MRKGVIILLLVLPFLAMSGGWPKKKGVGYYKLGYSIVNGTHFFNNSGQKTSLAQTLSFNTLSLYGAYGITDRLTALAYVPFATTAKLDHKIGFLKAKITTFGDTNLGLRYGLIIDKPTVLSVSATFGLPTGRTSTGTSGGGEASLQTGDGEFNQLFKLESGHSLSGGFYASTFVGINFRSKGFSEEIHFGGEIGHAGNKLISILKVSSISSLENGDDTETASADFFNNNMELMTIAPEICLKLSDKLGISVNYTIYLSGKKTLASPNTTFGVFLNL